MKDQEPDLSGFDLPRVLAENVRARLQSDERSAARIASLAGVSEGTMAKLRGEGGNPNLETLWRLAEAFSCSVSDLLAPYNPDAIPSAERAIWRASIRMAIGERAPVAGPPDMEVNLPRDWLVANIGDAPPQLIADRISGNSMAPTLIDGDLVLVDTGSAAVYPSPPGVFLFVEGPTRRVARMQFVPGADQKDIRVGYDDTRFESFTVAEGELEIVARVISKLTITTL